MEKVAGTAEAERDMRARWPGQEGVKTMLLLSSKFMF